MSEDNDNDNGYDLAEAPVIPLWRAGLQCNQNGGLKPNISNACLVLRHHNLLAGLFGYDELTESPILINEPPFRIHTELYSPIDWAAMTAIAAWIGQEERASFTVQTISEALVAVARMSPINPIKSYFDGLKWDRIPRLDDIWMIFNCPHEEPFPTFLTKWMVGAVARALHPGIKMDTMIVLEGDQGIRKSSALESLVPEVQWYREGAIDAQFKDGEMQNIGCWIREIGELSGINKQDINHLKSYLSRQADSFRPPYDRTVRTFKRRCVFAGTTNPKQYLNDPSGGRRFWPVPITKRIVIREIIACRDQLWAEALERFEGGETWYLDQDFERDVAMPVQRERLTASIKRELDRA